MSTPLTDFVRQLSSDRAQPSAELAEEVWGVLRAMLRAEMRRRSSWHHPPAYLGVIGHAGWTSFDKGSDALDELVGQLYQFVFVRRRRSLSDQAERKASVDGLVALNVRNFLLDIQKRHDPVGFRVFEVLRRVVRDEIADGRLHHVGGDPRVRNDTLVSKDPWNGDSRSIETAILAVNPTPLATRWASLHLEEIVTASHAAFGELRRQLGSELAAWLDDGKPGVQFAALATPLKQQIRQGWARLLGDSLTPSAMDDRAAARSRARFADLSRCVRRGIAELESRRKHRLYLERLWEFLESFAAEGPGFSELGVEIAELPSHRRMAKLLDIPRERIPELLDTLGEQLRACRVELGAAEPPHPWEMEMPPSDVPPSEDHAQLLAFESAAQKSRSAAGPDSTASPAWRVGDILRLPAADVAGVYWLLLAPGKAAGSVRAAAVDSSPLLGPEDIPLQELHPGDPWVVRQRFQLELPAALLKAGQPVDRIEAAVLGEALAAPESSGLARLDEELQAYRDWIEEGPERAHRELQAAVAAAPVRIADRRPRRRQPPWMAWAVAALVVVSAGLGIQLLQMRSALERLSRPIFDPPERQVTFQGNQRGGPDPIEIPPGTSEVLITFFRYTPSAYDAYRIEVLDEAGRRLHITEPALPKPSYTLTVPIALLDRPLVRFRLLGITGDTSTVVDEQRVVFRFVEEP
jgi:hypothetical protein